MLIALTVLATLLAMSASGFRALGSALSMQAATRSVRNHMVLARSLAVARRERVRLRLDATGDLVLLDDSDRRLAAASVGSRGEVRVDSVQLRPATLRFNSRGQAAPGSVYLYRGERTVRIVSNFLGRLRVESRRTP
jgi:Tfp pilus assembly protein FimT